MNEAYLNANVLATFAAPCAQATGAQCDALPAAGTGRDARSPLFAGLLQAAGRRSEPGGDDRFGGCEVQFEFELHGILART
jgi:hypothetical protein